MLEFFKPQFLWGALLIIPYLIWEIVFKEKKRVRFIHNRLVLLKRVSGWENLIRFLPVLLRALLIGIIFVSLARPRLANKQQEVTGKGIDIVLAIDVSGSMQAVDFKPVNRLEAAKTVAVEFIKKRLNDRIGVISFSEHAFTRCPLTLDYNFLMSVLETVDIDIQARGTAIGTGLATAVARLKDSEAKSKVIILITDGVNNAGEIDPYTAASLAKTFDIKVYTIGIGKGGEVLFPNRWGGLSKQVVEIDLDLLNEIAETCGTDRVRLARNTDELIKIMDEIDKMETTKVKVKNYFEYEELFPQLLLLALLVIILEIAARFFLLKQLP